MAQTLALFASPADRSLTVLCWWAFVSSRQDKKDRVNPDGTEYAVEHGGKGNFDGLKIVSAGAAINWQLQQSFK